jgi:hypothetical protein
VVPRPDQLRILFFGDSVDGCLMNFWGEHIRRKAGKVDMWPDGR